MSCYLFLFNRENRSRQTMQLVRNVAHIHEDNVTQDKRIKEVSVGVRLLIEALQTELYDNSIPAGGRERKRWKKEGRKRSGQKWPSKISTRELECKAIAKNIKVSRNSSQCKSLCITNVTDNQRQVHAIPCGAVQAEKESVLAPKSPYHPLPSHGRAINHITHIHAPATKHRFSLLPTLLAHSLQ